MNNELILSFILPCYNVEKYIRTCLDSLLGQDILTSEYEIICVNDCSTDGTKEKIEKYAKNHSNLILINHTINKTSGGARNTGIEAAKGKYIWFVDPDDFIKRDVLGELLAICEQNKLDELLFNYDLVNQNLEKLETEKHFSETEVVNGLRFVEKYFENDLSKLTIVWQQIYRLDFLKSNAIRFPEMRVSQDVPFAWKTLLKTKRMMSIDASPYIYRQNSDSITAKPKIIRGEILFSRTILLGYEIMLLLRDFETYPDIAAELKKTIRWAVNNFIPALYDADGEQTDIFRQCCVKNEDKILASARFFNRRNFLLLNSAGKNSFLFRVVLQMIYIFRKVL